MKSEILLDSWYTFCDKTSYIPDFTVWQCTAFIFRLTTEMAWGGVVKLLRDTKCFFKNSYFCNRLIEILGTRCVDVSLEAAGNTHRVPK